MLPKQASNTARIKYFKKMFFIFVHEYEKYMLILVNSLKNYYQSLKISFEFSAN